MDEGEARAVNMASKPEGDRRFRTIWISDIHLGTRGCKAFPVTGPIDVAADPKLGCIDWDLAKAARTALGKRPQDCRAHAERYSWRACAEIFLANLHPIMANRANESLIPSLMPE